MTLDKEPPRTRRALLRGGFGGLAAWMVGAAARPQAGLAATDTAAVHKAVNNTTSAATTITCSGATALRLFSQSDVGDGPGVRAETMSRAGVALRAQHTATSGPGGAIKAVTNSPGGYGLQAFSNAGVAVRGVASDAGGTGGSFTAPETGVALDISARRGSRPRASRRSSPATRPRW